MRKIFYSSTISLEVRLQRNCDILCVQHIFLFKEIQISSRRVNARRLGLPPRVHSARSHTRGGIFIGWPSITKLSRESPAKSSRGESRGLYRWSAQPAGLLRSEHYVWYLTFSVNAPRACKTGPFSFPSASFSSFSRLRFYARSCTGWTTLSRARARIGVTIELALCVSCEPYYPV